MCCVSTCAVSSRAGWGILILCESLTAPRAGLSRWQPFVCSLKSTEDFPGGPVVKNPPADAGDMGSIPGPGRFHMPRGNQVCVPQLLLHRVKLAHSRACAPPQEKPPQYVHAPHLERSCRSPQLEKSPHTARKAPCGQTR